LLVVFKRSALTSDSLYLRCPPKVLIEVNLPDFAHLVTVFGSTLNNVATSAGVNKTSCSEFNLVAPYCLVGEYVRFKPYEASIVVWVSK
jgi:hypothetical protein